MMGLFIINDYQNALVTQFVIVVAGDNYTILKKKIEYLTNKKNTSVEHIDIST